jgi:hypothetical protein
MTYAGSRLALNLVVSDYEARSVEKQSWSRTSCFPMVVVLSSRCRYWLSLPHDEPALQVLPARLWLIGLGHLGQAYLWALGLLPYPRSSQVCLVLQDVDVITPSTESTSVLSDTTLVGQKKTRAMAGRNVVDLKC